MVAAPALMGYVMRLLRRIIKTQNGILPLPIDNDDDDDDDENKNKEAKKNTLYRSLTCSRNECRDVFFTFFLCARWYISLFLFFFPKKLVALFPQWEKR